MPRPARPPEHPWDATGRITQRDFLTGFLKDEAVIGRPVDAAQGQDGSIYISDDHGGSIFRLSVGSPAFAARAATVAPPPQKPRMVQQSP